MSREDQVTKDVAEMCRYRNPEAAEERAAWVQLACSYATGTRYPNPIEAVMYADTMLDAFRVRFEPPKNEPQTPGSEGNSSEGE